MVVPASLQAPVRGLNPSVIQSNINQLESIANLVAPMEDEFDKYGKHIAAQLRAMPLRSVIVLQQQINNLITTERLNLIDSEVVPPSSTQHQGNWLIHQPLLL